MSHKTASFEEELKRLEEIVAYLESGNVSLEEALTVFQEGMMLSHSLEHTLLDAKETVIKIVEADGKETDWSNHDD